MVVYFARKARVTPALRQELPDDSNHQARGRQDCDVGLRFLFQRLRINFANISHLACFTKRVRVPKKFYLASEGSSHQEPEYRSRIIEQQKRAIGLIFSILRNALNALL